MSLQPLRRTNGEECKEDLVISIVQSASGASLGFENPITGVFQNAGSEFSGCLAIAHAALGIAHSNKMKVRVGVPEEGRTMYVHRGHEPLIRGALRQAATDLQLDHSIIVEPYGPPGCRSPKMPHAS